MNMASCSEILAVFQATASSLQIWGLVGTGVFLGMVVGILPGFGPPAAITLLFPIVYVVDPLPGISLLAGIFYGAKYGGAVTSILLGIPGEADAVATMTEGHPLAQKGKAVSALRVATAASFSGSILAVSGIILLAPLLSRWALFLGPPGSVLIMAGALLFLALSSPGGFRRGAAMVVLGLSLALIGTDPVYGTARLNFGCWQLSDGIKLTPLLLGFFGVGDLLDTLLFPPDSLRSPHTGKTPLLHVNSVAAAGLRGTILGFATGLFPCGAGVTASMAAHALEKKISRHPEEFGHGSWEGLAGPEAGNNAAAIASFAPLLLLGLPTNPIMAAMLGALTVGGIVPDPLLPERQPIFYWGIIFSLILGNILLFVFGLGLAGLWAKLARIPFRLLWPFILLLCLTGSYLATDGIYGPIQCMFFGIAAVLLKRNGYPLPPLILAFVLGPRLETHIIQTWLAFF